MLEWCEKWLEKRMRQFLGEMKPNLSGYGTVNWATLIDFPDNILKPEAHEQAYFGGNRDKLRKIKQRWDPDNFFNWPQGIRRPVQENDTEGSREALVNEEALTDQIALQQWKSYQPPGLDQLSRRSPAGLASGLVGILVMFLSLRSVLGMVWSLELPFVLLANLVNTWNVNILLLLDHSL